MDGAAQRLDGLDQATKHLPAVGPRGVGLLDGRRSGSQGAPQAGGRHLGRDLAALVAAEAIGDGKQLELWVAHKGIFVLLADPAHIAQPRCQESKRRSSL
jgi:hypothetical protein